MDPKNYKIPSRQKSSNNPRPIRATAPIGQQNYRQTVTNTKPVAQPKVVPQENYSQRLNLVQSDNTQPEYTLNATAEPINPKKKRLKKALITIIFLIILAVVSAVGTYYYFKKSNPPLQAKSNNSNSSSDTDFTLYKTANNYFYKSSNNFADGEQGSKILVATSNKTNNQITMTEQKVDNYFTSDPNGLDKLLKSLGQNSSAPYKGGTSYIINGDTTALTVKGNTLIIIKSTKALEFNQWVDLFNNVVKV